MQRSVDARVWLCCLLTSLGFVLVPRISFADDDLRVFDGFEEKFALEWEPLRLDDDMVSLTKNPGKLTITTTRGTLGTAYDQTNPAKNLYLIDNPVKDGGDFVITTCVESFKPTERWQQAGLLIYDDDDNYLKYDFEFSGETVMFKHMRETEQVRILDTDDPAPKVDRLWLRLTKRGNVYERSYSTDGKEFTAVAEKAWGNGDPTFVGIIAVNGNGTEVGIDAVFDFFELRGLTEAEAKDPRYAERKRVQGKWSVTSCQFAGEEVDSSTFSDFEFSGGKVTFAQDSRVVTVDFEIDPQADPKAISMSGITRDANQPVAGIYSLDKDEMVVCITLDPYGEAPTELESKPGDKRMLLKLKREK